MEQHGDRFSCQDSEDFYCCQYRRNLWKKCYKRFGIRACPTILRWQFINLRLMTNPVPRLETRQQRRQPYIPTSDQRLDTDSCHSNDVITRCHQTPDVINSLATTPNAYTSHGLMYNSIFNIIIQAHPVSLII